MSLNVRVTDLNYGDHLANDSIVSYLHVARTSLLESHSLSELNIGEGVSLIQGDLAVVYQSEGFLFNRISIKLAVGEFSNSSFTIYYALHNETTNKPLAKASTRMICFDYELRKAKPIPDGFKKLFSNQ